MDTSKWWRRGRVRRARGYRHHSKRTHKLYAHLYPGRVAFWRSSYGYPWKVGVWLHRSLMSRLYWREAGGFDAWWV